MEDPYEDSVIIVDPDSSTARLTSSKPATSDRSGVLLNSDASKVGQTRLGFNNSIIPDPATAPLPVLESSPVSLDRGVIHWRAAEELRRTFRPLWGPYLK